MADDSPLADFKLYHYDPSLAAAVVFIVCFVLVTGVHIYQLIRTRTWIAIPLVIGGFFEIIGYIGRALSSQESPNWTVGPYVMQSLLILIAPALFAASIYMLLGRIILSVGGFHLALIRQKWLTKIFVCGDVISFLMQASGGGLMASGTIEKVHLGEVTIIVGLFTQLVMFGFFVVVSIHFHVKFSRHGAKAALATGEAVPWRRHLLALYAASGLIGIRSIFRVIEYLQGNAGYLLQHEVYLYVFDACLMLLVMAVFNILHPSEITVYLRRTCVGERDGHHPLTVQV